MKTNRLALATAFVAALHAASRRNPRSWRRVRAMGLVAGIEDVEQLAQAVQDAAAAGLVYWRADDQCFVLTDKGRGIVNG